jgi:hypothetical protein
MQQPTSAVGLVLFACLAESFQCISASKENLVLLVCSCWREAARSRSSLSALCAQLITSCESGAHCLTRRAGKISLRTATIHHIYHIRASLAS